ncbi:MAG: Ppx/GppA family phosphatase [Kiritimatiellae bacterium]|nr:Ppx/GppA family phosphatase [Kiritimatiellia bacterium]
MSPRPPSPAATEPPRLVAVLDIGSTAIRMEIAEVAANRPPRTLESLSQPVGLGKDTFTIGSIRRETIEESVRILRRYADLMREYRITDPACIRAIATSAVKEAANRDAFLDRVYVATGIPVECAEDADLVRLTYLAVRDLRWTRAGSGRGPVLVVEVGGGSTEVLLLESGRVRFYETYPLGAVRLRETLDAGRVPAPRQRATLQQDIRRTVQQMVQASPVQRVNTLVAVSGDVRFAAEHLTDNWDRVRVGSLSPARLARFADRLLEMSPEEIAAEHGLSFVEAETLGPSLLAYSETAAAFHVRRIVVPKAHLRTALEVEMSIRPELAEEFRDHVRHAARMLADRYRVDRRHADQVAALAVTLFRELRDLHGLGVRHEFLLEIAARLHEVGLYVSNRSHHKHSMYLIQNSELFGVSQEDLVLIALIARYHRKSPPRPEHPVYGALPRPQRVVVQKLAALLRVADALDRSHQRRVDRVRVERRDNRVILSVPGAGDLTIERMALRDKGAMFEELFGVTLELVGAPEREETADEL